jgi:hypothetical protein
MSASLSPRFPAAGTRPTRQRLDDLEALLQRMLDLPAEAKASPVTGEPVQANRPALTLLVPPVTSYAAPEEASQPVSEAASTPPDAASPEPAPASVRAPEALAHQPAQPVAAPTEPVAATLTMPTAAATPAQPPATASSRAEQRAEPGAKEDWVPFSSNWRPSSQTWAPLRETWQKARAPEASPSAAPRPSAAGSSSPAGSPESAGKSLSLPTTLAKVEQAAAADDHNPPVATAAAPAPDLPPLPLWVKPLAWLNGGFDWLVQPLGPAGRWLRARNGKDMLGLVGILALAMAAGLMVADWYGWTW